MDTHARASWLLALLALLAVASCPLTLSIPMRPHSDETTEPEFDLNSLPVLNLTRRGPLGRLRVPAPKKKQDDDDGTPHPVDLSKYKPAKAWSNNPVVPEMETPKSRLRPDTSFSNDDALVTPVVNEEQSPEHPGKASVKYSDETNDRSPFAAAVVTNKLT